MGCGGVRLLRTIGGVDFTRQERATHNKLTMPFQGIRVWMDRLTPWGTRGLLLGRLIVPDLAWVWAVVGIYLTVFLGLNFVLDGPVRASI